MKYLELLMSLFHKIFFDKDETDINSSKFNSIKLAGVLLIILSCVFNIVAIKAIGDSQSTIKDLKAESIKHQDYKKCMNLAMSKLSDDILINHKTGQDHLLEMKYCDLSKNITITP